MVSPFVKLKGNSMYRELYFYKNTGFLNKESTYNEADIIIMGLPLDETSSGIPGSRYAPDIIRKVSLNLETYYPEYDLDVEDIPFHDIGNLGNLSLEKSLGIIEKTIEEMITDKKKIILMGGEHTISLPTILTLSKFYSNINITIFDAHLDLRDEYPFSCKISHATFLRRICEQLESYSITILGVRAFSKEEYIYAKENKINLISASEIKNDLQSVKRKLPKNTLLYLSIDIDVLDPSVAPGTGCPEPDGLDISMLRKIVRYLCRNNVIIASDITEVNPLADCNNITSYVAARLIMDLMALVFSREH